MPKRIAVIEDDESIREMIKMALTSFLYEVAAYGSAEEALAAIGDDAPDLAVIDIMLPGMSGMEMTQALRARRETSALPIVLLTAKDTELDKVAGLDCGADDYITKPFGVLELNARIRALFRRSDKKNAARGVDIQSISDLTINHKTREAMQNNTLLDLTYKEFELLCLLIQEKDRVVPREELLKIIWSIDFAGETRTLDIHIRTLRQKLGDNAETPKYIKTIRNFGYRFIG